MLKGKVQINEQEREGDYNFLGIKVYTTKGFAETFKQETHEIILESLILISENFPHADYFQTFTYEYPDGRVIRYWCIHDKTHITFLLPEEY